MANRYLSKSSGASQTNVNLVRGNDSSYAIHQSASLVDVSALAEKYWTFGTDVGYTSFGLQLSYEERKWPSHVPLYHQDFTWSSALPSFNVYISSTTTTLDPSGSPALKMTTQTLDQYGNLTQMRVYNFGNLSTPARTYTNTYLTDSNYTSRYILNRLTNSTVTDGTYTTTLALNYYDYCAFGYSNVTGLHEHDDANYGQYFNYRGDLAISITPSTYSSTCFDMAGNVIRSTVNGVTTTATTDSSTNFAVPSAITTNTLSSQMTWSTFLGLNSATGPNGDSSSIVYDTNARPSSTTAPPNSATPPYGAVTTYAYYDNASPPNKVATTNGNWTQTIMDGFGRTINTVTGYGSTTLSTVDTVYSP